MATILRTPLGFRPQQKTPIAAVDSFSRALTLGINPNAAIAQLSHSAPRTAPRVYIDVYPNLLSTTLHGIGPAVLDLPERSGRIFDSAPVKRYYPDPESSQGFLVYDGPDAAIAQLSDSAPRKRKDPEVFQVPNLMTNILGQTVALGPPLLSVRLDASAPSVKYQVRVEALYRPLTLGINANAPIGQLSDSAPPPKRPAYPFDPPNLIDNTLAEPLTLPRLALRIDVSAPQVKLPAYAFDPPNTLVFRDTTNFVIVPYLIGKTQDAATLRINGVYCVATVIGPSGTVTAQDPPFMTLVARGATITITLGGTANNASSQLLKGPRYGQRADATRDRKFRIH